MIWTMCKSMTSHHYSSRIILSIKHSAADGIENQRCGWNPAITLNHITMSISKTRQKLVDVARQLFAKNGIANTTMNDIAVASGKGRRTLYTYFKSKDDVYYAVIEGELERLSDKLDEVAAKNISPQEKIIELIYTHLSMIKETVIRNGNLRAEFFRNIWMVEKTRKNFDEDELELFRKVYAEGKADGEFDIENVDLVADITHYCIKGLEVPFIYGRLGQGLPEETSRPLVAKVVYGALGKNGIR